MARFQILVIKMKIRKHYYTTSLQIMTIFQMLKIY
ncbi:MAG: hypothetical protein Harvfovirus58_2 [Harvfovirus sp.]|uniref:Uncharacterized protein n=1 Tax=Harvfovirus sp. TaxID=2487768 RepID=A0A3G5A5G1_9VIRU|nr:MAG: hypothetical protein Harvfovirus58_2 [Harvfovirus sp.]